MSDPTLDPTAGNTTDQTTDQPTEQFNTETMERTTPQMTDQMTSQMTDSEAEPMVAHGELVDAPPSAVAADDEPAEIERREAVEEPAKVMRIGSMIKQLLDEVRAAELDEAARGRLREIYDTSVQELGSALSPDLRAELDRVAIPFGEGDSPSDAELRIAQAQLVGWLEGLFHGIQATLFAQQVAARNQLEGIRNQLPGQVVPGGPGAPRGPVGEDGPVPPGTYL